MVKQSVWLFVCFLLCDHFLVTREKLVFKFFFFLKMLVLFRLSSLELDGTVLRAALTCHEEVWERLL